MNDKSMNKNNIIETKTANSYVCRKCFNRIWECTCEHRPLYLIHIDIELQPHIRILNEKNYRTVACCSGHDFIGSGPYILFPFNYFKDFEEDKIPKNFKYTASRNGFTLRYHVKSKKDTPETREQSIKDLLEFCKGLEPRSDFKMRE